ncbi:cytochrome P450 [Punctularia strigosozonata HHB-11173 SS5]|uniref:cytochrome P450 n=1 Tax=Punctularia strigosozonata (strain HHB-11173) TaxID=741275 RepID=UPI0004417F9A|nr:cytochrome P450 [Punctularia strigosozonata HHB-11173 SS5]EIN09015.1 cytochrome P450 [Punctularia strigosozonata HHB-11173 SS5]
MFAVPPELQHLPRVPVIPTLLSFAKGEVEDVRIKKLLLPYATRGDSVIAKDLADDINTYPKEVPPDGMLLWRFVGYSNIILSNGEAWKRHSKVVRDALQRNLPIEEFASLARKLFHQMDLAIEADQKSPVESKREKQFGGGRVRWEDLTMRFTLDAVGTTAMGHNFNAIEDGDSPFVTKYNKVMEDIANPLYLVFPRFEKWFPRLNVIRSIDELVAQFQGLLERKKEYPGNDMLTFMLEDKNITDTEHRDNMVVFFIGGHDTTAGAMASLVYYMGKYPDIQKRARAEVQAAMKGNTTGEPTIAELKNMPFLEACIREALRVNTPITYMVPRSAMRDAVLVDSYGKQYFMPKGASIITNITSIHYRDDYWPNAREFQPERFMGNTEAQTTEIDSAQWLPFALGARQCPARNFAMYEQRTLGSMLLREWEWTIPDDTIHTDIIHNAFSPFALSLPKDLFIRFRRLANN